MARNSGGSSRTRFLISLLALAATATSHAASRDSEMQALEDEIATARNELDDEAAKPGVKSDDPRLQAKAAEIDAKQKRLEELFRKRNTRAEPPAAARPSSTRPKGGGSGEPETVLSSEGIQAEIKYRKKAAAKGEERPNARSSPAPSPGDEPSPEATVLGNGIQEIQYGKKPAPAPSGK